MTCMEAIELSKKKNVPTLFKCRIDTSVFICKWGVLYMLILKQSIAICIFTCYLLSNPMCIPRFQILDIEANKCRGIDYINTVVQSMREGTSVSRIRPVPKADTSDLLPYPTFTCQPPPSIAQHMIILKQLLALFNHRSGQQNKCLTSCLVVLSRVCLKYPSKEGSANVSNIPNYGRALITQNEVNRSKTF